MAILSKSNDKCQTTAGLVQYTTFEELEKRTRIGK